MTPIRTDYIVVKLKVWEPKHINDVVGACGGYEFGRRVPRAKLFRVCVPLGEGSDEILIKYNQHPVVEKAFFDGVLRTASVYHAATDDALLDQCWHAKRMNLFHAWKYGKGSSAIKVGSADSGLILNHVDLKYPEAGNYYNTTLDEASYEDAWAYDSYYGSDYSHGTNVHSCMFALTDNALGVIGVCPDCTPVVMVCNGDYETYPTYGFSAYDLADAHYMAMDVMGCKIMSNSTVFVTTEGELLSDPLLELKAATDYFWAEGGIVLAAAGNNAQSLTALQMNPGENPYVVTVGAHQQDDDRSVWSPGSASNYGSAVDIVAPGTDIGLVDALPMGDPPLYVKSGYAFWNGTSFATPLTAGVVALIWSANPNLTNQEVVDILLGATDASRHPDFTADFPNAGIVNAAKAVLSALTTVPANAGIVYPYVNFYGAGVTVTADPNTSTAQTVLDGEVSIELGGYSSDPITSVELWVDGVKRYDGLPTTVACEAVYSVGSEVSFKVVARTATGSAEETYTDIMLTSLDLPEIASIVLSGGGDIYATQGNLMAPSIAARTKFIPATCGGA